MKATTGCQQSKREVDRDFFPAFTIHFSHVQAQGIHKSFLRKVARSIAKGLRQHGTSRKSCKTALIRCNPNNISRVALADSRCHLRKAEAGRACLSYAKPFRPARSSDTRDWPCQANNASFSHGQVLYAFYIDRSYRQPSASSECRRVHMASAR